MEPMIFVGLAIGLSSAIVAVMLRLPRESPALRTHEYELEPHMHRVLLDGVGRILDEAAHYLPAESLVLARQIFERGEGSNTLDELAWVIVRHEQPVPSSLIRNLRACFVELAPTDVLPAALDRFAIERADGEADDSTATFAVHHDPIWRDRADFILQARLDEPESYEQLWVKRVADDEFEVCCIPFFLYDVALGDRVRSRADGQWSHLLDSVVEDAGHYGFRAYFSSQALKERETVVAALVELGALVEFSSENMIAVDARDQAHAQIVADYLLAAERDLGVVYETSRSGSESGGGAR